MSDLDDFAKEAEEADDAVWFKDLEREFRLKSGELITRTEQLTHSDTLLAFEKRAVRKLIEENKALVAENESAAAILEFACKWGERSHPMDAVQHLWQRTKDAEAQMDAALAQVGSANDSVLAAAKAVEAENDALKKRLIERVDQHKIVSWEWEKTLRERDVLKKQCLDHEAVRRVQQAERYRLNAANERLTKQFVTQQEQIRNLIADNKRLRKGALCLSEDPKTGLRCEFKLGHGCELHSSGSFAWGDA